MKFLISIALAALAVSLWSLANPREVFIEKTVIVEKEIQPVITYNVTASRPAPQVVKMYRWIPSEAYTQWKNSVKTADKYSLEHFGLGEPGSSGQWEEYYVPRR